LHASVRLSHEDSCKTTVMQPMYAGRAGGRIYRDARGLDLDPGRCGPQLLYPSPKNSRSGDSCCAA
jgi:hypothetical protein